MGRIDIIKSKLVLAGLTSLQGDISFSILNELQRRQPINGKDLHTVLGLKQANFSSKMISLVKNGYVEYVIDGKNKMYRITDKLEKQINIIKNSSLCSTR